MIEFYGEVTDYTKRRTDKLRKRYMSNWIFVLAGVIVVIALIVLFTTSGNNWLWVGLFAVLLAVVGFFLRFGPMRKSVSNAKWLVRVQIEGEKILWVQYLPDKTVRKEKMIDSIKKVYRTKFCYYLVYNNLSNAIICERCLLKRGTFDRLEYTFEGKIRNLEI